MVQSDSPEELANRAKKAWRLQQMPVQLSNFVTKPPLIASEWPPASDWRSANNNSLGDWDKCCVPASELPQHLATFGNSSLTMLTAQQPEEKIHPDGYTIPKEDGRKSSDHTNSYDVSASQSPSNDGAQSDGTSDEQIDVECMTLIEEMETEENEDTIQMDERPGTVTEIQSEYDAKSDTGNEESITKSDAILSANEAVPTSSMLVPVMPLFLQSSAQTPLPAPIPITPTAATIAENLKSPTIEEALLLTLSKQQFAEVLAEAAKIRKPSSESIGFTRSGTSAFANIEHKDITVGSPSVNNNNDEAHASTVSTSSTPTTTTSASFCRPPGLGPVTLPPTQNGQTQMLVCPICGFMCPSKFHFNSHMNTHGDHQCSMCDYTSRTEGRLKKHMRESHTVEEQLRAGLDIPPVKETSGNNSSSPKGSVSSKDSSATSPINESFNLSTTLASLLDSSNAAISSISTTEQPAAISALSLEMNSTPSLLSTLQNSFPASALDHIKAISENPNFLPENGISLASALGVVQAMKGEPASPEKQSNGECRRSSSGKVKTIKCKQCGHLSFSKNDQWAHARTHIPAEKQLNCQHCNFVTEYKHHLEYHKLNHIGSKPFQCKKCAYNCVNKSMLNSHMKSHTNHYQFKCMDCTYATKYCHSLKLHLKKYNHRRVPEGIDMNGGDTSPTLSSSDATITFSPIVKQEVKSEPSELVSQMASPFPFNPIMAGQGLNFANQMLLNKHLDVGLMGLMNPVRPSFKCAVCDFVAVSQEEQMTHSMSHILNSNNVPTTIASLYSSLNLPTLSHIKQEPDNVPEPMECDVKVEEEQIPEKHSEEEMESSESAVSPTGCSQISSGDEEANTRQSISLEQINAITHRNNSPLSGDSVVENYVETTEDAQHSPSDEVSGATSLNQRVSIAAPIPVSPHNDVLFQTLFAQASLAMNLANRNNSFMCNHCKITFNNEQVYEAHMDFHTSGNPFKCTKCQFQAFNQLNFALHVFQAKH